MLRNSSIFLARTATRVSGSPSQVGIPMFHGVRNMWSKVEQGPEDPILGLTVAFNKDTFEKKANFGVGAYRDDEGKPFVLDCVREAEKRIAGSFNHEYAPIAGLPEFVTESQKLILGADSKALAEKRVATIQCISGTGSLRVLFEFINKFLGDVKVLLPNPTWGNHKNIIQDSNLSFDTYRYWDNDLKGIDMAGLLEDIQNAPDGSVVLLHTCAHNPTGMDPDRDQWKQIAEVTRAKGHLCFFDTAYQGFASGDADNDAWSLRYFVENNIPVVYAQSFAKNMGLYGQRCGALGFVCDSEKEKEAVLSQMKILARPMYSNPPIHGARIAAEIMGDAGLRAKWSEEVKVMADRINAMRTSLVAELAAAGSTLDWSHVTKQIGMFCFTGLTPEQVDTMREEYHIYMTRDGRVSMAGVTTKNVQYLAQSIHAVTK